MLWYQLYDGKETYRREWRDLTKEVAQDKKIVLEVDAKLERFDLRDNLESGIVLSFITFCECNWDP